MKNITFKNVNEAVLNFKNNCEDASERDIVCFIAGMTATLALVFNGKDKTEIYQEIVPLLYESKDLN